jgi:hypothetical protein
MTQETWQVATSGRYRRLSRPIGLPVPGPVMETTSAGRGYVVSVQAQTLLFLLFAMLVGGGLLMIVPNLSAATGGAGDGVASVVGTVADLSPGESDGQLQTSSSTTDALQAGLTDEFPAAKGEAVSQAGISPVFTREVQYWAPRIIEWSELYDLDPDIIATIMQIESCGDPAAASHAGAQGLFQVMPFHFEAGEDMLDPDTNARRGMAFYNRQLEYTGWDIYLSFAGYNGGYAASGSSYPYWANETQRYYTWAKGIYDDAKAGLQESPTLQQWLVAGGGGGCQRAAQRLGL